MLIYTHAITERCRYIFELIFGDILQLPFTLTDDPDRYQTYEKEKASYTFEKPAAGFFIESATLLFENSIRKVETAVFPFAGSQAFFRTAGDFSFDIFAASFYLVSRYEEYLPSAADRYGRYQAKNSLAHKHGFLQIPVVNRWALELKQSLAAYYPSLSFQETAFRSITSFDIDVAYAFKGRSFFRNIFVMLKDVFFANTKKIVKRLKVINGQEQDPYDTYQEAQELLSQYKTEPLFFFLLKRTPTRFDRNLSPSSGQLGQLIRYISTFSDIGIHPSYFSIENPYLIQQEKQLLENICSRPVTKSRQHYLRFRLPATYLHLIKAGITDDYSMGYAETPGFRAGICTPFYFYDLKEDRITTLKIHPITYMDGSFIEDLQMRPEESMKTIKELVQAVKEVNGVFMCIWHNHTISDYGDYKGWKQVLNETLQLVNNR